jgi:hypothetical protein
MGPQERSAVAALDKDSLELKMTLRVVQVNPIAVNSKYCNVFTENKRCVSILKTEEFGDVSSLSTSHYGPR